MERGAAARAGSLFAETVSSPARVAVVTTEAVREEYQRSLPNALEAARLQTVEIILPGGEHPKDLNAAGDVFKRLADSKVGSVAACGGLSLCRFAGFVAANYAYGIPWTAFPTTLSAMFAPGFYAHVNVYFERNYDCVGATWPPALVVADPAFLSTLPARFTSEGLSHAVCAAVSAGPETFALLEEQAPGLTRAGEALDEVIFTFLELQTRKEKRPPPGSCLGKVFGEVSRYGFTPGEATAVGLVYEGLLAELAGKVSTDFTVRLSDLLRTFNLPVYLPSLKTEEMANVFNRLFGSPEAQVELNVPYGFGDIRPELIPARALLRIIPELHRLARER